MDSKLEAFCTDSVLYMIQQTQYNHEAMKFMDFIQVKLRCCGASSFSDYQKYGMTMPTSCYLGGTNHVNEQGCGGILARFLELRCAIMGSICCCAAVLELILIGLSVILFCIKRKISKMRSKRRSNLL